MQCTDPPTHPHAHINMHTHTQGYDITLFNRGKTANRPVPGETQAAFEERVGKTKFVVGDRTNPEVCHS